MKFSYAEGVVTSSPGLAAAADDPGVLVATDANNPEGGCALFAPTHVACGAQWAEDVATTPLGFFLAFRQSTQGSACGATLGWRTKPR
jgi:hypothetical protein